MILYTLSGVCLRRVRLADLGSGRRIFPSRHHCHGRSTNDNLSTNDLQVERQVDVNLVGTMRVTKVCLPLLKVNLQMTMMQNWDDNIMFLTTRGEADEF